jgi:hypothetical protein
VAHTHGMMVAMGQLMIYRNHFQQLLEIRILLVGGWKTVAVVVQLLLTLL